MSGAAIGSRAFARIECRPYLYDQLIQIWELRQERQAKRDEWLELMPHLLEVLAMDQRNIHRSADAPPFGPIIPQLKGEKPEKKRAERDEEDEFARKIAESERKRREARHKD